jgi:outer membrane protein assembly factor BamA
MPTVVIQRARAAETSARLRPLGSRSRDTAREMRLALAAIVLAAAATAARADVVKEIVVGDNTKTTADTVTFISRLDVGDEWTPDMATTLRERLVSSGLFKDVEVYWEPMDGGVRVHILVKDKFSWVVAPAFYTQPTNVGGGIGYGENNLFGLNQKLLVYAQIATGSSFFVGVWQVPSIAGTRFHSQLDTYLADVRNIEYAEPTSYLDDPVAVRESRLHYLNVGGKFGFDIVHGVKLDGRVRAASVGYAGVKLADGATAAQVGVPDGARIPAPGKSGWDVSSEVDFIIDRRANWYGIASGYRIGFSYEQSVAALGSDFHYKEGGADFYRAIRFFEQHNLTINAHLNVGEHMPFQQEFLMGGTDMRGWLNNQFRGDFKAAGNLEYSVPLFTVYGLSVRGLSFWDTGYTTFRTTDNPERNYLPDSEPRGLAPFKNSVGVGTRLYLRQIVLPLLGLDFGYGLEARDFQVYLAIGLTD